MDGHLAPFDDCACAVKGSLNAQCQDDVNNAVKRRSRIQSLFIVNENSPGKIKQKLIILHNHARAVRDPKPRMQEQSATSSCSRDVTIMLVRILTCPQ